MTSIQESELVLAPDGSLYHIHLTADTLADNVLLVGDPGRVDMFRTLFDRIEYESCNRELHALTGRYHGTQFTALSTGMGCDNIDIVLTELDAAANMNLTQRCPKPTHRTLNLVRIGTSGSLQSDIDCGTLVASAYAIGLDGLLNYYTHDASQLCPELNSRFIEHMHLPACMATPYSAPAATSLLDRVAGDMHHGITATAPGFYAPQGRNVRIAPTLPDLNERLAAFQWDGLRLTNLEMETSALYGLSRIMGHQALTVCLIIANRPRGTFLNEYHDPMRQALATVMDRMCH